MWQLGHLIAKLGELALKIVGLNGRIVVYTVLFIVLFKCRLLTPLVRQHCCNFAKFRLDNNLS